METCEIVRLFLLFAITNGLILFMVFIFPDYLDKFIYGKPSRTYKIYKLYYRFIRRRFLPDIMIRRRNLDKCIGAYNGKYSDCITLLPSEEYSNVYNEIYVLLHELGHWTGHFSRTNRNTIDASYVMTDRPSIPNCVTYYREELVADLIAKRLAKFYNLKQVPFLKYHKTSKKLSLVKLEEHLEPYAIDKINMPKDQFKTKKFSFYREIVVLANDGFKYIIQNKKYVKQIRKKLPSCIMGDPTNFLQSVQSV